MGPAMVDWDRVEELRSKGWDWNKIASDPKVAFHADSSVRDPGRALRALYHRHRSRQQRQGTPASGPKKATEAREPRWTLIRVGYLLTPLIGIWALLAYVAPSPVGVIIGAIPYLALALAVAVFILLFGLWRTHKDRWSPALRRTVVVGIVLGLVVSGLIALGGYVIFGCPYLPPASTGTSQPGGQGWVKVPAAAWQDGGKPVFYFYGAIWCPYCSASSWALYKALTAFGSLSGEYPDYSSTASTEPYPGTPEMVLGAASLSSSYVSWQVSMYLGGTDGTFPSTSNCFQQAYVSAYSGSSIPFVVLNGQYVHASATLVDPSQLSSYAQGANGGANAVLSQIQSESGVAWNAVSTQAWWIMAFLAKSTGATASNLASQPYVSGWTSADRTNVANDLSAL